MQLIMHVMFVGVSEHKHNPFSRSPKEVSFPGSFSLLISPWLGAADTWCKAWQGLLAFSCALGMSRIGEIPIADLLVQGTLGVALSPSTMHVSSASICCPLMT